MSEFAESFKSFHVGRAIQRELATPFDKSKSHPAALTKSKYGASKKELLKACLAREFTLMKRMAIVFILRLIQVSNISTTIIFNSLRLDCTFGLKVSRLCDFDPSNCGNWIPKYLNCYNEVPPSLYSPIFNARSLLVLKIGQHGNKRTYCNNCGYLGTHLLPLEPVRSHNCNT